MKEVELEKKFELFLLFFIFINLIQVVNNDYLSRSLDLDYTHALSLLNGNTFIIL